jgi:hypothetical protein
MRVIPKMATQYFKEPPHARFPSSDPNLTCLTKKRADLRKAVEEAEWLGEAERLAVAEEELFWVEDQITKGYLYEPNF